MLLRNSKSVPSNSNKLNPENFSTELITDVAQYSAELSEVRKSVINEPLENLFGLDIGVRKLVSAANLPLRDMPSQVPPD